jgi:hypothetical protein
MTRMTFSPRWAALRISGRGAFAIGELGLTSLMDGFFYATDHGRYCEGSHTRPLQRAQALRGRLAGLLRPIERARAQARRSAGDGRPTDTTERPTQENASAEAHSARCRGWAHRRALAGPILDLRAGPAAIGTRGLAGPRREAQGALARAEDPGGRAGLDMWEVGYRAVRPGSTRCVA